MKTINRQGSNQHKKRRRIRWGRIFIILLIIGGAYLYLRSYSKPVETSQVQVQENDGLTDQQRADLKKQADLAIQAQVLKNKKDALDTKYKADSEELEVEMQKVRQEQMSFK